MTLGEWKLGGGNTPTPYNETNMNASQAISELERLAPQSVPRIKLEDIAGSWLDLHAKLCLGEIPMPFWLEINGIFFEVTKENHDHLSAGILLGLRAQNYFDSVRFSSQANSHNVARVP